MGKQGALTAAIGSQLTLKNFDVYYDHGTASENVGKIVSTLKPAYGKDDELSQVDIAIVEQDTEKVAALVEIEETSDRPKVLLGDIFGVLLGNHIFFKRRELQVGDNTTLIVIGVSKTQHLERNKHIQDYVNKIKHSLGTQNSNVGKVVIKIFQDDKKVLAKLPALLEKIVNESMKNDD